MTSKKIKKICNYDDCNKKLNPTICMIGKCKYCEYIYCSNHRLPENHNCVNQEGSNKRDYDINSKKNNIATNRSKIQKI
jgi:predicted nucleic acid binding AN1-type Zn finger protein